ncbi:MAG: pirin family protein [Deltaproteobacteria bacterium]|nr:pirin family protein [Deltaproteobacteria bacterium]
MITLRRDRERHHGRRRRSDVWLTFYPGADTDPLAGGFGALDVFSENQLPPGAGVSPQPRREAEVVTYVQSGALAQQDSTGHSGMVQAGEFQLRTIGRKVHHSERNASETDWAHIFRMSLRPAAAAPAQSYEQRLFPVAERRGVLCVVASPDGRGNSLHLHQDATILSAILEPGQHLIHELAPGRCVWLHVVQGEVTLDDVVLASGDGVGVANERSVSATAREEAEILLLDLPALPPTSPTQEVSHEHGEHRSSRRRPVAPARAHRGARPRNRAAAEAGSGGRRQDAAGCHPDALVRAGRHARAWP